MRRLAWLAGILVQAVVLGSLLFYAILEIVSLTAGTRVFTYQGY
jgi:hypothetical protein